MPTFLERLAAEEEAELKRQKQQSPSTPTPPPANTTVIPEGVDWHKKAVGAGVSPSANAPAIPSAVIPEGVDWHKKAVGAGVSPSANAPKPKKVEIDLDHPAVEWFAQAQGAPYFYGGTDKKRGIDCSAAMQQAYAKVGVKLPRTADEQFHSTMRVEPGQVKPGDMIFFKGTNSKKPGKITHVGIVAANGVMGNAGTDGVGFESYNTPYWRKRIAGFGRPKGGQRETISEKMLQPGAAGLNLPESWREKPAPKKSISVQVTTPQAPPKRFGSWLELATPDPKVEKQLAEEERRRVQSLAREEERRLLTNQKLNWDANPLTLAKKLYALRKLNNNMQDTPSNILETKMRSYDIGALQSLHDSALKAGNTDLSSAVKRVIEQTTPSPVLEKMQGLDWRTAEFWKTGILEGGIPDVAANQIGMQADTMATAALLTLVGGGVGAATGGILSKVIPAATAAAGVFASDFKMEDVSTYSQVLSEAGAPLNNADALNTWLSDNADQVERAKAIAKKRGLAVGKTDAIFTLLGAGVLARAAGRARRLAEAGKAMSRGEKALTAGTVGAIEFASEPAGEGSGLLAEGKSLSEPESIRAMGEEGIYSVGTSATMTAAQIAASGALATPQIATKVIKGEPIAPNWPPRAYAARPRITEAKAVEGGFRVTVDDIPIPEVLPVASTKEAINAAREHPVYKLAAIQKTVRATPDLGGATVELTDDGALRITGKGGAVGILRRATAEEAKAKMEASRASADISRRNAGGKLAAGWYEGGVMTLVDGASIDDVAHEASHWMRDVGLVTDAEFEAVVRWSAKADPTIGKAIAQLEKQAAQGDPDAARLLMIERDEAFARAVQRYAQTQLAPASIQSILARVRELWNRMTNVDYRQARGGMQALHSGQTVNRALPGATPQTASPASPASPAPTPAPEPEPTVTPPLTPDSTPAPEPMPAPETAEDEQRRQGHPGALIDPVRHPKPAPEPAPAPAAHPVPREPENETLGKFFTHGYSIVHPQDISFDPDRFQFKGNYDKKTGSTGSLKGVKKWNRDLAGVVLVWVDPADGRTYVINGHNRLSKALELLAKGDTDASEVIVKEIKAETDEEAMVIGAVTNISEGKGTELDAAKIFRNNNARFTDTELEQMGVDLNGKLARTGRALAGLNDDLYAMVVNGKLNLENAEIIGRELAGMPEVQRRMMEQVIKHPKWKRSRDPKRVDNDWLTNLAKVYAAGKTEVVKTQQGRLPKSTGDQQVIGGDGFDEITTRALEMADVLTYTRRRLAEDRNIGSILSRERTRALLETDKGIEVDREYGQGLADEVKAVLALLDENVGRWIPLLTGAADRMHAATNDEQRQAIRHETYERLRSELEADARGESTDNSAGAGLPGQRAAVGETPGQHSPEAVPERPETATGGGRAADGLDSEPPVVDTLTGDLFGEAPQSPPAQAGGTISEAPAEIVQGTMSPPPSVPQANTATNARGETVYKHPKTGEEYIISDGISGGRSWGTYTRKPNGGLKRVTSPKVPVRASREEAEADLKRWLGLSAEPARDAESHTVTPDVTPVTKTPKVGPANAVQAALDGIDVDTVAPLSPGKSPALGKLVAALEGQENAVPGLHYLTYAYSQLRDDKTNTGMRKDRLRELLRVGKAELASPELVEAKRKALADPALEHADEAVFRSLLELEDVGTLEDILADVKAQKEAIDTAVAESIEEEEAKKSTPRKAPWQMTRGEWAEQMQDTYLAAFEEGINSAARTVLSSIHSTLLRRVLGEGITNTGALRRWWHAENNKYMAYNTEQATRARNKGIPYRTQTLLKQLSTKGTFGETEQAEMLRKDLLAFHRVMADPEVEAKRISGITPEALGELGTGEHAGHRQYVSDAIDEGKPVPAEVLEEYPDLKRRIPPPETEPATPEAPKPETPDPAADTITPSPEESLELTAQGHEDNEAAQAARRVLEKRRQRQVTEEPPTIHILKPADSGKADAAVTSTSSEWDTQDPRLEALLAKEDDIPLEDAVNAHRWNSMQPEDRARQARRDYTSHLNFSLLALWDKFTGDDQRAMLEEQWPAIRERFRQNYLTMLGRRGNTASALVTGPANFPTARNKKALAAEAATERKLYDDFNKAHDRLQSQLRKAGSALEDMLTKYFGASMVEHVGMSGTRSYGKERRDVLKSAMRTNIKKIGMIHGAEGRNRARAALRAAQDKTGVALFPPSDRIWGDPTEIPGNTKPPASGEELLARFDGATVMVNFDEDRVQIDFKAKPNETLRAALKGAGWHWSPRNNVWQRKNTENAEVSALYILRKFMEQDETIVPGPNTYASRIRGKRPDLNTPATDENPDVRFAARPEEQEYDDARRAYEGMGEAPRVRPYASAEEKLDDWRGVDEWEDEAKLRGERYKTAERTLRQKRGEFSDTSDTAAELRRRTQEAMDILNNETDQGFFDFYFPDGVETVAPPVDTTDGTTLREAAMQVAEDNGWSEEQIENLSRTLNARDAAQAAHERANPDVRFAAMRDAVEEALRSPKFLQFFRRSKVVDEDAKPKVLFRGSSYADRSVFNPARSAPENLFGHGIYMTEDPEIASQYAHTGRGGAAGVYPLFARIENPLDMDAPADVDLWNRMFPDYPQDPDGAGRSYLSPDGKFTNESAFRYVQEEMLFEEIPGYEAAESFLYAFDRAGFDGLTHMGGGRVHKDSKRHRVWIAFDSTQVKSVFNGGEWGEDPDIRFAVRSLFDDEDIPAAKVSGRIYGIQYKALTPADIKRHRLERLKGFSTENTPLKYVRVADDRDALTPEEMAALGVFEAHDPYVKTTFRPGERRIGLSPPYTYRYEGKGQWSKYDGGQWQLPKAVDPEIARQWIADTKRNREAVALKVGTALIDPSNPPKYQRTLFAVIGEHGAKEAELKNLEVAKEMKAKGLDATTIWLATGWQLAKDGKWRAEQGDKTARLIGDDPFNPKSDSVKSGKSRRGGLSSVLHFPALYARYPELELDVDVAWHWHTPHPDGYLATIETHRSWVNDSTGHVTPPTYTINLYAMPTKRVALSSLLHEVQHVIQAIEGFPTGANYQTEPGKTKAERIRSYRRAPGEVEGRIVQARHGLSAAERKATPLSESADVKDVLFDEEPVRFAVIPDGKAPQKTVRAYKLFERGRDGGLYPLKFPDKGKPVPVGVWIEAEVKPKKPGFAHRPGWHAGRLPDAGWLKQRSTGDYDPNRVWAEVELSADVDWQPEADASKSKDIKHDIPRGGMYRFPRPGNQGGEWVIAGTMRINRVLTPDEVQGILADAKDDIRFAARPDDPEPDQKSLFDDVDVVVEEGLKYIGSQNVTRMDWDTFDDGKAVLQGMGELFDDSREAIRQQRRGVQTWSETRALAQAKALGITPKMLSRIKPGTAFNSENATALRMAFMHLARKWEQAQAAFAASGTVEDMAARDLALAEWKIAMLAVQGAMTESGRSMQAHRMLAQEVRRLGSKKDLLYQRLLELRGPVDDALMIAIADIPDNDTVALFRILNKAAKAQAKWGDHLHTVLYCNMLSSTNPHGMNLYGNLSHTLLERAAYANAAGIDKVRSAVTGAEREIYFVPALHKAARAKAFYDVAGTLGRALDRGITLAKEGFTVEQAERFDIPHGHSLPPIRINGKDYWNPYEWDLRALGTADEIQRSIAEQISINDGCVTAAINNLKRQGKRFGVDEIAEEAIRVRDKLIEHPEIIEEARKQGDRILLTSPPGDQMLEPFMKMINGEVLNTGLRPLKTIVPFIRVMANSSKRQMEWSPLGTLKLLNKGLSVKERELTISRAMLGTTLAVALYTGAMAGMFDIEGEPPEDTGGRSLKDSSGRKAWSLRIPGTKRWVPLYVGGILAPMLYGVAAAVDATKGNRSDEEVRTAFWGGVRGMFKGLTDQSFMMQASTILNALADSGSRWQNYVDSAVGNVMGQFVPMGGLLGQIANATDKTRRDTRRWSDDKSVLGPAVARVKSRIPGLRQTLPPAVDVLGREQPQNPTGLAAFSKLIGTDERPDPIQDELLRIGWAPGYVGKEFSRDKVTYKLTREQWLDYQRKAGTAAYDGLSRLFDSEGYREASDEQKIEMARKVVERARTAVRGQVKARVMTAP